eukprot:COSAG01_NODE_413_length_17368_cov_15.823672_7_plen_616_part_00
MASITGGAETGIVKAEALAVRHLGRRLLFVDVATDVGPLQLCFDSSTFGTTEEAVSASAGAASEGDSGRACCQGGQITPQPAHMTAFPHKRSDLRVGDKFRAEYRLQCRPTCAALARCVVWWERAPRPVPVPSSAQQQRAAKKATRAAEGLERARRRLSWAKLAIPSAGDARKPCCLPGSVLALVGHRIRGSSRARRQRRPAHAHSSTATSGAEHDLLPPADGHSFADAVGKLALEAFRARCPRFAASQTDQTVLASVIVRHCPPCSGNAEAVNIGTLPASDGLSGAQLSTSAASAMETMTQFMRVVSFGVGTKFMPAHDVTARAEEGRIRDSHAEVLARRGLLRFLYAEIARCWKSEDGRVGDDDDSAEAAQECSNHGGRAVFERRASDGKCVLKRGVTFHLYTSSAPCGNACLSRWTRSASTNGRGTSEDCASAYLRSVYPRRHIGAPERQLFSAKHEGQIAALIKGSWLDSSDSTAAAATQPPAPEPYQHVPRELLSCDRHGTVPPGCSSILANPTHADELANHLGIDAVVGRASYSLSCSDKIARWQSLGFQGVLLLRWLATPLYFETISVGRKFSQARCERALCCRLQDFRPERCVEVTTTLCPAHAMQC